jgi:hypothetical protein
MKVFTCNNFDTPAKRQTLGQVKKQNAFKKSYSRKTDFLPEKMARSLKIVFFWNNFFRGILSL